MNVDGARDVYQDNSAWRSAVSAYPVYVPMYVCKVSKFERIGLSQTQFSFFIKFCLEQALINVKKCTGLENLL